MQQKTQRILLQSEKNRDNGIRHFIFNNVFISMTKYTYTMFNIILFNIILFNILFRYYRFIV